jgi:hypothetical protein
MSDPAGIHAELWRQSADAVLMIRPAAFGWNPETRASNRFQAADPPAAGDLNVRAAAEFDGLVNALLAAGVDVHALPDRQELACPDAVFPNNWVSLHPDGTVVLYPMLAPSRRRERRPDVLAELTRRGGFRVSRLLDLTHHELQGRYLEGTGSVVFDHVARVAYACLSPRTDADVFGELCAEFDYEGVTFRAVDAQGMPVYHTNVVLAIGSRLGVVCAEAVRDDERGMLLERLTAGGRAVECIDRAQMCQFAANLLELRNRAGETLLAVSSRGLASLAPAARERLAGSVDRIVSVPVPTIEELGGGSVRCTLAEVFLPRDAAAAPPGS